MSETRGNVLHAVVTAQKRFARYWCFAKEKRELTESAPADESMKETKQARLLHCTHQGTVMVTWLLFNTWKVPGAH